MAKVYGLAIHEWAPADDARKPTFPTFLNRGLRHAPLTERAVKPHGANLSLRGLLDNLERDSRMRGDHDTI